MRVIVVGAGIGGLVAAIALRRRSVEVTVVERAADPREIGAGITLWPNAMRALRTLGLADAVIAAGAPALSGEIRSRRGEVLSRPTFDDLERRFGEQGVAIHRADLRRLLLAALDPSIVRLGARYVGSTEDGDAITVRLADGDRERADVLVGADGLRSTVRSHLWGEMPPRYAGYTAWRGVVTAASDDVGFESWGRGERFGLVPIGTDRVYWFATANAPEGGRDAADPRPELLRRFGDWHRPIPAIIAATPAPAILRHDVSDRPPLSRWSKGRVTLLGDAAHPMTPNLGQGACQAIEDALAASLDGASNVADALHAYDALRLPLTSALVRQSRTIGRIGQLQSAPLVRLRDLALKRLPPRSHARRLERILAGGTAGDAPCD